MLSLPVVSVFLLCAGAATALSNPVEHQTLVEVIPIKRWSFLKANKSGELLVPLTENRDTKGTIRYTLGQRASNDGLVSQASDSLSWNTPQNVQLSLEYPASRTGALITYVEIDVNQSSNSGRAYVVAGGIGQRRIVIMVEAYSTNWFSYVSSIFGV